MIKTEWDIILAGSGMSGLTLALECARRPWFRDKKILLIDRDKKTKNDRTWCFWATEDEPLPDVIFKSWEKCRFFGEKIESVMDIRPYRYHMIRGLDFYEQALKELAKSPNVSLLTANIEGIEASSGVVRTDKGDFSGEWVFNSALTKVAVLPEASALYPAPPFSVLHDQTTAPEHQLTGFTQMLQHFKGWLIETPHPAFDPALMTFMDYRPEQKGETRFVYVLPFSETRALVEFTVFSAELCPAEEYDLELDKYIRENLGITGFRVEETEFGVIPMTDYPFSTIREGRVLHIGTAGGFVKASSGYAFKRTQRKLRKLVDNWERTGVPDPQILRSGWRYRFYDSVMLRVLRDHAMGGRDFFSGLFRKLPPQLVFRFLDEDTSILDDIQLLSAPPAWLFFKTALKQIPFFSKI